MESGGDVFGRKNMRRGMRLIPYPDFKNMTTLKMGGRGILEVIVERDDEFDFLPFILDREGGIPFVIGKGSNLLVEDGLIPVVLIRIGFGNEIDIVREDTDSVILRVGSSVSFARLLRFCIKNGFCGLEGLMGIPATVGGAIAMNAGSFGYEMKDVVEKVVVWSKNLGFLSIEKENLKFEYRTFLADIVEEFWCVTEVELLLKKDDPHRVKKKAREYYFRKKNTQPILTHTCGCVFKNPSLDLPAGLLLDKIGLKGHRIGDVMFSDLHANFLINLGNGRTKDALELMELAKTRVKENFGIDLELEVELLSQVLT